MDWRHCVVKYKNRSEDKMPDNKSLIDDEARSRKVIKIALIAFSIVELIVMVVIFVKHKIS